MATDPALLIQAAVFDVLRADATLMALVKGVFDHVPRTTAFPYLTIGESMLSDWGSHTFDGANALVTIHSWARGAGRKECRQVMAEVYRILHRGTIAVTGFTVTQLRFEFGEVMLDPDGQTYHGVQRFRIFVGGN